MIVVEIELPEKTARWFRSMASLGRLCDSLQDAINSESNELSIAEEYLPELKTHLMALESTLRPKLVALGLEPLWDQNQSS